MLRRPLVSIDSIAPTSVRLRWDAISGASAYVVQYFDVLSGQTLGSLTVDATIVDIYQLQPATKYAATVYSTHRTLRSTGFTLTFTTPVTSLSAALPCGGSELYPSAPMLPVTNEHALVASGVGYIYDDGDSADNEGGGIVTNPRDNTYVQYYKFALFHAGRIAAATTCFGLQILTPGGAWSTDAVGALRSTILQVALVYDGGARRTQWYDANSPFVFAGADTADGSRCCLGRHEKASTSYRAITFGGRIVDAGTDVYVRIGITGDGRFLSGIRLA